MKTIAAATPPTISPPVRVTPLGTEGTLYIALDGQFLDKNRLAWTCNFTAACLFPNWNAAREALAQVFKRKDNADERSR